MAMQVWGRCGDEWITAGMDGTMIAISSPSVESVMNLMGISDPQQRLMIYDRVKMISRVIAGELWKEKNMRKETRGAE